MKPHISDEENEKERKSRIVKDGEVLRVPLMLMDSMSAEQRAAMTLADQITRTAQPSSPSSQRTVPISDADRDRREALLEKRDKKLQDAWRDPAPVLGVVPPKQQSAAPLLTEDSAARYARRNARLEQKWRNP